MNKIIFIVLITLFFGCQDLDLSPEHQLSDGSLWKRSEDFEAGVNVLYNTLGSHQNDADSDIAYGNNPNSTSNGTRVASATSSFYNSSYENIRRCNFLIDRANANGFENDRYVAEARWFRAFHYSKLVQDFGDVPFYTEALDPSAEELFDSRTPRNEIVSFLLQELSAIAPILPEQSELNDSELGRITRGAADALRARIALFEGTWIKYHGISGDANAMFDIAINASKEVINSGQYELFHYSQNPTESYRYFFMESGNDSKEQIVARRYDYQRSHGLSRGAEEGRYTPTKKLADMYLCKDGLPISQSSLYQGKELMTSEFQGRDPRMLMTFIIPGTYTIGSLDQEGTGIDYPKIIWDQSLYKNYKYITEFFGDIQGLRNTFFYHALRYAEVLLIYAEALYEKNGTITDNQLNESINLIRERAGMPNLTNEHVNTHGLDMLTEIRRERTIELAHEGFRRDDLRRWKKAEVEMPKALLGVKFKGTEWETAKLQDGSLRYPDVNNINEAGYIIVEPASQRSFDPERDYLEPLPSEELIINSNLEQNPGW